MAVVKPLLTPDDISRMMESGEIEPGSKFELVNGEIVWLAPAFYPQSVINLLIGSAVLPFAKSIGALAFSSDGGFMVGPDHRQLRAPDFSLVTKERRHIVRPRAWQSEAPDLAVEVLSDDEMNNAYKLAKLAEYFSAGAKVVWFVDYRTKSVRVHIAGLSEYFEYSEEDFINLDAIAPGFSCRVAEFFPE